MQDFEALDGFDARLDALETALGGATAMTAAFEAELSKMQATVLDTGKDVSVLSGGISRGLRRAFDGLVFDGMRLSDALKGVAKSLVDTAYAAAIKPVTSHLGGLLAEGVAGIMNGLLPFEKGGSFVQGRVMPFAQGGVVSGPVRFPMRGGMGLMGEAGPEAIMPLSRGSDGKLGVRMDGGGGRPVQVVMNITSPDAESFRRSSSQIAAEVGRAIQRGNRNR
jgi:hypothetical protein